VVSVEGEETIGKLVTVPSASVVGTKKVNLSSLELVLLVSVKLSIRVDFTTVSGRGVSKAEDSPWLSVETLGLEADPSIVVACPEEAELVEIGEPSNMVDELVHQSVRVKGAKFGPSFLVDAHD
jgi:hypothetical protein